MRCNEGRREIKSKHKHMAQIKYWLHLNEVTTLVSKRKELSYLCINQPRRRTASVDGSVV